tara:strand:+ start:501 stop:1232 length:732 start_codon:yes stop_codon:yes gene_type:complete
MLINEVVSETNKFPLLEADLIKDKQPVEYKGLKYVWSEKDQHFTGGKYPRGVPQGEMLEYMILRQAGIVRRDGQLSPTMMKRFSNNVKAQLKNPFSKPGDEPNKEPGAVSNAFSDMKGQNFSRAIGTGIGSLVGSGIDRLLKGKKQTVGKKFHFISKKGNKPVNGTLVKAFYPKDKPTAVQLKIEGGSTLTIGSDKLIPGWYDPSKKPNNPTNPKPDDSQPSFNNAQDNLDPNVDYDTPPNLR